MFWKNYIKYCNSVGKSPNKIATEIGCSSGSVTAWKNGRMPKWGTLEKIANYFGVTVDYLIGNDVSVKDTNSDNITFDDFTYALHNETQGLSDEDKKMLLEMAKMLKKRVDKKEKK